MNTETESAVSGVVASYPILRIAPPLIAIGLAIVFKEVNFALSLAVLFGCLLLANFDILDSINGLCDVFVQQVADTDHASVILFTVMLGTMICLMNDSGGTSAVVDRVARFANSRKRGQILTWFAGILVFFDDYANTMLIGGSVRPLTDKLQISRAKLAFLIDATAAPIAGLALSTWTAVELGYVQEGIENAQLTANATDVFVATIPYRIYPIVAIVFVGVIAFSGKDFGPMLKAERELDVDDKESDLKPDTSNASMWTAIIPVTVLLATVCGLLAQAYFDHRSKVTKNPQAVDSGWLASVDSYRLLLVTSLAGSVAAVLSALAFRKLTLLQCSDSWAKGITSMIPAITVLVLAWGINSICGNESLATADYISSLIGDSVRPQLLPAIAFVASGAIAVSVGSSYATMGLLIPMFVPLSVVILQSSGAAFAADDSVFLATVGAILAGAIFGDHCSPISDTTVLSSAAAGCDHLQHVATQVPYALVVAASSLLFGYLPIGFGVPWWIALPVCIAASVGAILFLGHSPDEIKKPLVQK